MGWTKYGNKECCVRKNLTSWTEIDMRPFTLWTRERDTRIISLHIFHNIFFSFFCSHAAITITTKPFRHQEFLLNNHESFHWLWQSRRVTWELSFFNLLQIIYLLGRAKNKRRYWIFNCFCLRFDSKFQLGKEIEVSYQGIVVKLKDDFLLLFKDLEIFSFTLPNRRC